MSKRDPGERVAAKGDQILERNVGELLARSHEPPRMDAQARARVLAALKAQVTDSSAKADVVAGVRSWPRLAVVGVALTAFAAAAAVIMAVGGGGGSPIVHDNAAAPPRVVALGDGSELTLDRDAAVEMVGPRHARLRRGQVMLEVARGPSPFVIETAGGRVVVLGTRFLLDADDAETTATVVRGAIRLENAAGAEVLRAGEQGVLRQGERPTRRPAPRLSHTAGWIKQARRQVEQPGPEALRRGTLLARNPQLHSIEHPLPMRALTIDVHVESEIARVAIDQTFYNPQPATLEGVYRFPLPPDAAVSRLAMYVDGVRMESAVVERQRARQIYESIVYRRLDPALLEWMAGNLFQVRIFPLPPREEKRIVLAYTQPLRRLYDDVSLEVPIPEVDAPVGQVRYQVRLVGCGGGCQVSSPSHELSRERDGDDLLVGFEAKDHVIGDDLLLTVRDPAPRPRVARHRAGGADYVMVRAQPAIDAAPRQHRPRRWVMLHDTSASRGAVERKAQAFLIDRLLRDLDARDEVNVIAFDATARHFAPSFAPIAALDPRAVAAFLAEQSRDGVGLTDLSGALAQALGLLDAAGDELEPHILYLGDGIVTGGEREVAALSRQLAGRATFVAVAVGDQVDARLLGALTAATGGLLSMMNPGEDLAWRAFDLVATLDTGRVVDLEAVLLDADGRPLPGQLYAGDSQLADGEQVTVVARLDGGAPASLSLRGAVDGRPWRRVIDLADADVVTDAAYLPRLWAQRRVDALLVADGDDDERRAEVARLGAAHFLLTPHTSLIVLENEAMYRQFGVKQGRARQWAHYELPDRIEVVRGSIGQLAAVVPADAALVRSPRPVLQEPWVVYGRGGIISGADLSGWARGEVRGHGGLGTIGQGGLGTIGHGGGGGGRGRGAGGTGTGPGYGDATRARVSAATAADEPPTAGLRAITTDELRGVQDRWQMQQAVTTRRSAGPLADHTDALEMALGGGLVGVGGRSRFGWDGHGPRAHYYDHGGAPMPSALRHARDPLLDDLTELVPALFEDVLDERHRALAGAGAAGSIDDGARALLDRARREVRPARYVWPDGGAVTVTADGRVDAQRRLDSGLAERALWADGALWHLYDELGLAVRRPMAGMAGLVVDQHAPFVVPDPDWLGRHHRVTLAGPRVVRVAPAGDGDGAIEIAFDDHFRVAEIRGGAAGALRFEHGAGQLVIVEGDRRTELAVEQAAPIAAVDPSAWTVVEMPLRTPSHWAAALESAAAGERRRLRRQLLASLAALGDVEGLWEALAAIAAEDTPSRGELALAGRAVHSARARAGLAEILAEVADDDPVARYLRAAHQTVHRSGRGALEALAADAGDSLIGTLARYRAFLAGMNVDAVAAKRRLDAFAERTGHATLRYLAAHAYASRYSWRHTEGAVAAWDMAAEHGPLRAVAAYQAARLLLSRSRHDEAADRFAKIFSAELGDAVLPRADHAMASAFRHGSRGEAGWRLLWNDWRTRVMADGTPAELLSFLRSAAGTGELREVERVVARVVGLRVDDPDLAAAFADELGALGRPDQALAILTPHLSREDAAASLLERASLLAERQGATAEAAAHLERAMNRYYDEATDLHTLRTNYTRLMTIYTRMAQGQAGPDRERAAARALAVAAEWRVLDPDNATVDSLAADLLYSLGRPEEAWRHLSTAIERRPAEGEPYQLVATALEREGQIERAETLWRRAAEVDPTNPTWPLRRAQALLALGRKGEARAVIAEVVAGDWHDRFFRELGQARALHQRLRP